MRRYLVLALLVGLLAVPMAAQSSRNFDGTDDGITCGDQDALEGISNLTVGCWAFGVNQADNNNGLIRKGNVSPWRLYVQGNETVNFQINDGTGRIAGGTAYTLGVWNLVVGTYDQSLASSRVKVYLNGVAVGSDNGSDAPIVSTADAVAIGYEPSTGNTFNQGAIAHCFAVPRTWSAAEIAEAYRGNLALIQRAAGQGGGYISLMDPEATPTTYRGQGLFAGACSATNHPAVSSDGPAVFLPGGG